MNIFKINENALIATKTLLNKNVNLGSREWCLISAVDDRVKYITIFLLDQKTGVLIPVKLDRFNVNYENYQVVYGIFAALLNKVSTIINKQPENPIDLNTLKIKAKNRRTKYESTLELKYGGKLHLFSWEGEIIV